MFISINHTIDKPHPIACQCTDCVTKQNYDSLKRSRSGRGEVKVAAARLPGAGQPGVHGAVEPGPDHDHVPAETGDETARAGRKGVQGTTFSVQGRIWIKSGLMLQQWHRVYR